MRTRPQLEQLWLRPAILVQQLSRVGGPTLGSPTTNVGPDWCRRLVTLPSAAGRIRAMPACISWDSPLACQPGLQLAFNAKLPAPSAPAALEWRCRVLLCLLSVFHLVA